MTAPTTPRVPANASRLPVRVHACARSRRTSAPRRKGKCVDKYAAYLLKCHEKAELKALGPPDPLACKRPRTSSTAAWTPRRGASRSPRRRPWVQCFTNDDTATMQERGRCVRLGGGGRRGSVVPRGDRRQVLRGKEEVRDQARRRPLQVPRQVRSEKPPRRLRVPGEGDDQARRRSDPGEGMLREARSEVRGRLPDDDDSSALGSAAQRSPKTSACDLDPYQAACSTCGNNIAETPPEDCDGTDDAACPGACTAACNCP